MRKVILVLLLIAAIALNAQQKPNTVVHSSKRGFGWQMGKRAGNDAYDALKAEGKKVVKRLKKKKKTSSTSSAVDGTQHGATRKRKPSKRPKNGT